MKKLLLSIWTFSSLVFAQGIDHLYFGIDTHDCDKLLKRESYFSCYSYVTKGPIWTAYITTLELSAYRRDREDLFSSDKEIPKQYRAELSDYKKSGYDRGHLHPNALADFSENAQRESFLLSNIVPQLATHNRTAWRELETKVRYMAKQEKIISVVTGVLFKEDFKTIGNGVAVPDYFYKVILLPKSERTYAFLLPHKKMKRFDYEKYQTTVDNIEEITGMDFFSNVKPQLQDEIESKKYSLEKIPYVK